MFIIVTAVKKAEEDSALIVRLYEWAGKAGDVSIQLPTGATSASETDLMERSSGPLSISNGEVKVPVKAYEIKTIRVAYPAVTEMAERP